jgi:hypothetical protein
MVILYIYSTSWCFKSVFYERQQWWGGEMADRSTVVRYQEDGGYRRGGEVIGAE